jgi:uncharacterized protein YdhG (YjbR/CyaY superfamily)
MQSIKFATVNEYLTSFPEKERKILERFRKAILQAAPGSEEIISYNMPAYRQNGILVYFAAHKEHIGFYPADTSFHDVFKGDLANFQISKGTIRFPMNNEIPIDFIERIVKYRVKQNQVRSELKVTGKKVK